MDYQKHFFSSQSADLADTSIGRLPTHEAIEECAHWLLLNAPSKDLHGQKLVWFFYQLGLTKHTTSPHKPYPCPLRRTVIFSKR